MSKPLISVIVPIYNMENCLTRCIMSIINQTYYHLEILLVNDGSTDSSGEICDRFQAIDNRIKKIDVTNGGISRARNIGFANANGEYIGFVDSDDWIEPEMYETLHYNLEKNDADISVCNVYYEFHNKVVLNKISNHGNTVLNKEELYDAALDSQYFFGYVWNKLFKKTLMMKMSKNYQIFDETIHKCEDLLFVAKYISESSKGIYTSTPFYHYVQRLWDPNSHKDFNLKIYSLINAYDELINVYTLFSPKQLSKLKLNYTKINLNFKYRVLNSKVEFVNLKQLDANISKYLVSIKKCGNISINQKINVMISYHFPKLTGVIKLFVKKHMKYRLQGR